MAASLVSLMIICMAFTIPKAQADARTDVVSRSCGKVNVTRPEILSQRYSSMFNKMKGDMGSGRKFATSESGDAPDRVYVLGQCMDDLSNTECEACFQQVNYLLQHCLPATGGRVYLDGCFARFDNYSFFKEVTSPADSKRCSIDIEPDEDFKVLVDNVIMKMVKKAPGNSGFAEEQANDKGLSAYGIASCWKTLDQQSCDKCLLAAASSALSCLPSIEGRALHAGCYLRYSYYEFANSKISQKEKEMSGDYLALVYFSYFVYALVVCVSAIGVGFYLGKMTYSKKLRRNLQKGMELDLSAIHGTLHFLEFKYSTIDKATESFCEANKLGRGGYGEVFKGTLPDGREIAIKRLFLTRKNRIKEELCTEMDIISRAQHKNLVRFLGCCFTNADSIFVYEYLANKSLDRILFNQEGKKKLDWKTRLGIIIGTAEGLEFLHNGQVQIIHRDIKASNILLDLKYRPKIADFGLAKFYSRDKSIPISTGIAGTLGYMAPEYIAKGQLTDKVDVYSFGVLILEIISGVRNNNFQSENLFETLVINAWKHFQANTVSEIMDNSIEKTEENMEEMKRIVWVGLLCTQESASQRPTMKNVVRMLKQKDMTLPTPSEPPFTDEWMQLEVSVHRHQSSMSSLQPSISS